MNKEWALRIDDIYMIPHALSSFLKYQSWAVNAEITTIAMTVERFGKHLAVIFSPYILAEGYVMNLINNNNSKVFLIFLNTPDNNL